ncbi:MAG: hypothetical protein A3J59_01425 [Candidatus Buchananbacteria bacterium RIFCSPHIGHO2_02_FULL_56_16]|uniref:ATP synthase subunit a n=1 Tax=Candidatus Buchananbacteria bacterium RIFCSPHIGHO2_02_FULL_56_16 TaxID=1797542 RepID=A0A1G1YE62_9BACT|nr:MAG: hypothetical protein A3J59_01425 [Candidatus Buchananbacteria bacterium RIFCSPHIGHO2_02_FULL_56_16]
MTAPISENQIEAAAVPAAETSEQPGELTHETTLFAEPIGTVAGLTVTNSLLTSWIVVGLIVVVAIVSRLKMSRIPSGFQNYLEVVVDKALELADSVTGSRATSMKFLPIVFPLFIFILLSNWLGLLPGVGSIGFIEQHGGERLFVPLLRGSTADLNTTLALALMAVIATHVFSVVATSFWGYLNRFVGLNLILELPKKVFVEREYTALLVNPIKFFVGLIELVGELAKVASLSFRLFGNIFAGEVLLGAMAVIFAYVLPIPFMFLEIIVGVIQALIFAMLTLVFLNVMTTSHEESH